MIAYRIQQQELYIFLKAAKQSAHRGREVCGLLVRHENQLVLVPVTNATKEPGSFCITPTYAQIALAAHGVDGNQVEGTYHSHPFSPAQPGESDVTGARPGSLMLIASCWDNQIQLWRIQDAKARSVRLLRSRA